MVQKRDAKGKFLPKPKRGGVREGAGRPAIGSRRTYGIVLPDEEWQKVDFLIKQSGAKPAEFLRDRLQELVYAAERNSQTSPDEYGY